MDNTAPATKEDIGLIMNEIGKLYMANEQWKNDLEESIEKKAEETKQHFDVVAENLHANMLGAHTDKISVIDDRSLQNRSRIEKLEKVLAI